MYGRRLYREAMGFGRFRSVSLSVEESDVWIGYSPEVDAPSLIRHSASVLLRLRLEIQNYPDKQFLTAFTPLKNQGEQKSELLALMLQASNMTNTGPMASVAGAIAQQLGKELKKAFGLEEILVENGGDLYIDVAKPLKVKLFAPTSPLSGKVGVVVDPKLGPMGICTSSAKIGHSFSFGRADAVMVATSDAALADALATAYCNRVQAAVDVQTLCEELSAREDVLSALVLMDETLAIGGRLEVCT